MTMKRKRPAAVTEMLRQRANALKPRVGDDAQGAGQPSRADPAGRAPGEPKPPKPVKTPKPPKPLKPPTPELQCALKACVEGASQLSLRISAEYLEGDTQGQVICALGILLSAAVDAQCHLYTKEGAHPPVWLTRLRDDLRCLIGAVARAEIAGTAGSIEEVAREARRQLISRAPVH
jgi:hypothetical protein